MQLERIESRPSKPDFSVFYEQYHKKVFYYIKNKVTNPLDAEDLTGDVFEYCYRHYDSYDPNKSALTTWLYMITNCRVKNFYRDTRSYIDLETVIGTIPDTVDLDEGVYLEQMRKLCEAAMHKLSERQRLIVRMRYYEDKTNAEIARALGMSQGNVRVQLSRALDTLEKHVEIE